MAMSTSCPVPGSIGPPLAFTVPATFTSLALTFEVEPTWVSPRRPMAEQLLGCPNKANVARLSEPLCDDAQAVGPESARNRLPTSATLQPRRTRRELGNVICIAWTPFSAELRSRPPPTRRLRSHYGQRSPTRSSRPPPIRPDVTNNSFPVHAPFEKPPLIRHVHLITHSLTSGRDLRRPPGPEGRRGAPRGRLRECDPAAGRSGTSAHTDRPTGLTVDPESIRQERTVVSLGLGGASLQHKRYAASAPHCPTEARPVRRRAPCERGPRFRRSGTAV